MTRGLVLWKQREASRALRACAQAGQKVTGFEVTRDGTIRVLIDQGNGSQGAASLKPADSPPGLRSWD
jgi:hypothetical protein